MMIYLRPTKRFAVLMLMLAAPGVADAAELALRERALYRGSIVCLGDVAEIKAAPGEQINVDQLAARQLMPAPAPGEVRYLRPSELLRLLSASGLDVQSIQFTGAESVVIGAAALSSDAEPPVQRAAPSNRAQAEAQLAAAIMKHLHEQTGHDMWNVRPNIDKSETHARLAGMPLKVTGGKAPWTGHQRFEVDNGLGQSVAVTAQVERVQLVVFTVRPIERGALVGVADVELRPHAGAVPAQAFATLESIIGKEAVTAVRPGAMLLSNQVRAATLVRRGERVSVRVRAAGVTVRTFATAQQDGAEGDLIMVESLAGKERYTASVTSSSEVEVFAARSTAVDVARRPSTQEAGLQ
jgi:flagella basal body P-ring formation protein FlgA